MPKITETQAIDHLDKIHKILDNQGRTSTEKTKALGKLNKLPFLPFSSGENTITRRFIFLLNEYHISQCSKLITLIADRKRLEESLPF